MRAEPQHKRQDTGGRCALCPLGQGQLSSVPLSLPASLSADVAAFSLHMPQAQRRSSASPLVNCPLFSPTILGPHDSGDTCVKSLLVDEAVLGCTNFPYKASSCIPSAPAQWLVSKLKSMWGDEVAFGLTSSWSSCAMVGCQHADTGQVFAARNSSSMFAYACG